MENKIEKNDRPSFLHLTQQREHAERMDKLFVRAVGDEDVSKREENVKHFDLGANRYQAVVYSEPVHFRESEDEDWQEIDNTLEETVNAQGRAVLKNRANRMHVEFPLQMDGGSMATITEGGKIFSWRFEQEAQPIRAKVRTGAELKQERLVKQAQKMAKFVGRTIDSLKNADLSAEIETEQERRADIANLKAENTYEEVLPGVSVRYTLRSETVKEDIILANAEALSRAAIRLPKQFAYAVDEGKKLLVKDKTTGDLVFTVNTPFVYDAASKETIADVVLTDCGEYIRMEYVLDAAFMAEAQFPVTIDPVVHSTNPVHNIQDTTLGEGQSATPYTENHMKIGKYGGSVRCVGLLKFNILAIPKACDTVIQAVLQLAPKSCSTSNYIGAYEVLRPWESASVNWLNFNPDNTSNIAADALECVKGSSNTWLNFDLTNLYRKWCTRNASGVSNNNGVAFRSPENISGNNYCELYSSDASASYRPTMYVNYISHAGIEGWWQYEQMSAGRAGTVYSDLFNGNMVLEHSDTVMTGNRNPVSVNHYYNSCLSTANSYNCGYGWKTDAHQKITARTHNKSNYYVWEDGDGTEHFFEYTGSQPYKDCEGMDLELTVNSSNTQIMITDKQDNAMLFQIVQSGLAWLIATKDACGNISNYSYVSGYEAVGRLDKITDPVGRVTQFAYDSNGLISSIRIPAAVDGSYRYVYYTYDSAKRLTGVRYSDLGGTVAHTTYSYDGSTNLLTKAHNYDGVQVNVSYEATSLYGTSATDDARRVLSLETVGTGAVTKYGAKQVFSYGAMTTEVTAVENTSSDDGKKIYYQFNDAGNVVCVRDDLGFAKFTKFESGIENKPSEESKLRKAVVNRLRKSDFNSQWTSATTGGTATKDTSTTCLNCYSIKMAKTGAGEAIYRQQVALEEGTPFTLSAYVKTDSLAGGGAFLRIKPMTTGAFTAVTSDTITGTTDPAVGNELPTDGWERIRVTLDALTAPAQAYVELVCNATSGTAWFACPQLETGEVMNTFNMVSNGDFRYTTTSGAQRLPLDWDQGANNLTTANTGVFEASTDEAFPSALEGNYVQVEGRPDKSLMGFVQYYDMTGKAGDIFVVGGWADGKSVPNANTRDKGFTLALSLKKSDGTWIKPAVYPFNDEWVGWQQSCYAAAAGADYTQIALYILYTGNCNKAKFTNIFLHREAYGTTFGYDDKGNVLSTSNLAGQKSKATYDSADNVQTYVQPGRDNSVSDNQYWAYYGDTDADKKKHLPWRTRTPMHMTDYYEYDEYGNQINRRRLDYRVYTDGIAENAYPFIRTSSLYNDNGNYTVAEIDSKGNRTSFEVNDVTGMLEKVTDPNGKIITYSYDACNRNTESNIFVANQSHTTRISYEGDNKKSISHNTSADVNDDVIYSVDYDALRRRINFKVGGETLVTTSYSPKRNRLKASLQYANGGINRYFYDEYDRLVGVAHEDTAPDSMRYKYTYAANGMVAKVVDNELNRVIYTSYDLADRPCEMKITSTQGEALYAIKLVYDKMSNLGQSIYTFDDPHLIAYEYNRDNIVTRISYDTDYALTYEFDELGRIRKRTMAHDTAIDTNYEYEAGNTEYGEKATSHLIKAITTGSGSNELSCIYTYDACKNVTSETRDLERNDYHYDAKGQLIRVDSQKENCTWVYTYDYGGNMLCKQKYPYTAASAEVSGNAVTEINYAYNNSNWKDQLTRYNNVAIKYDAAGNQTSDGKWTYSWHAGRLLESMNSSEQTINYSYDHNDLRVKKVVDNVVTDYYMHGDMLVRMTRGNDEIIFFYDKDKTPIMIEYMGTKYYYVRNALDDVIAIIDKDGSVVVQYYYDPWGKLLDVTGSMANSLGELNPLRYRGYIYDNETGLYYLRSRYYDPEKCRFISPDIHSSVTQSNDLANKNLYSYCDNNPNSRIDENGCAWFLASLASAAIGAAVGAVVSGVVSIASQAIAGDEINWKTVGVAAASGAVTGAAATTKWNRTAQAVIGGAVGGIAYVAECAWRDDKEFDTWEFAGAVVGGAVSGYLGGDGCGGDLADLQAYETRLIARESRRRNQKYAAKAISKATQYVRDSATNIAVSSAAKYTGGAIGGALANYVITAGGREVRKGTIIGRDYVGGKLVLIRA